ncbi:Tripartite tricarboxylate transporter TctA family protein [Planctomycetales bacterium 10988]|nr:Tripartite tricarboxylate transporter TctA family protein [Planctomycetales bacterium 10988]
MYFLAWEPLGLMILGTILGILVGAIPGLTGAMLIALTLPLTFSMDYRDALVLLVSMYVGSISGGLITATLLRMPGTPASMMTTLDGFPMAKKGEPGRALGLGIMASFVGGIISWVFLVLLAQPIAILSTKLGPFDMFSLVLVALVLMATVSSGSLIKGLFSGLLGMLATIPGTSPATGALRWTGGMTELNDGFELLPVLVGLFALSQVVDDILKIDQSWQPLEVSRKGIWMKLADWRAQWVNMIRSSFIGTWVGILPGVGANIGSLMAYSLAKSGSRTPEKFGEGSEEGIVASEAANNATVGGALIPLIAMGIPGSVIDAILLGALVIHGLQPGPLLFEQNPEVAYTVMMTYLGSNFVMLLFMVVAVSWIAQLIRVPRWLLIPLILVFCVVGSYALNHRMFDVWVMLGFGLLGYVLERWKIPLAPFVIGFVLTPTAEENLAAGLMTSGGSYLPLITRPVSLVFMLISLALFLWPCWQAWRNHKAAAKAE